MFRVLGAVWFTIVAALNSNNHLAMMTPTPTPNPPSPTDAAFRGHPTVHYISESSMLANSIATPLIPVGMACVARHTV